MENINTEKKSVSIVMPAHLNTKSCPNKLIVPIDSEGTTLFDIACFKLAFIKANSDIPTFVLIHEDEKDLIEIAQKWNVDILIRKDDKSIDIDNPINYPYNTLSKATNEFVSTHIMLLNPSAPFVEATTLIQACKNFVESNLDYATSVKPFFGHLFDANNGTTLTQMNYENIGNNGNHFYQTADIFHIFNGDKFAVDKCILNENHSVYAMSTEAECIVVNTTLDLHYASAVWNLYKLQNEFVNQNENNESNSEESVGAKEE